MNRLRLQLLGQKESNIRKSPTLQHVQFQACLTDPSLHTAINRKGYMFHWPSEQASVHNHRGRTDFRRGYVRILNFQEKFMEMQYCNVAESHPSYMVNLHIVLIACRLFTSIHILSVDIFLTRSTRYSNAMLHSAPFDRVLMELTAITSAVGMMMHDEN